MRYKITKHIPNFCDVDKEKQLFVENLEDLYNLEFVKRITKLEKFDHFQINEDKTLLLVHFSNNTYYVLAYIEDLENKSKGPLF